MKKSVKIERVEFAQTVQIFNTGIPSEYLSAGQVICGGDYSVVLNFDSDERFLKITLSPNTEKAEKSDWVRKSQLISLNNCRAILLAPGE